MAANEIFNNVRHNSSDCFLLQVTTNCPYIEKYVLVTACHIRGDITILYKSSEASTWQQCKNNSKCTGLVERILVLERGSISNKLCLYFTAGNLLCSFV